MSVSPRKISGIHKQIKQTFWYKTEEEQTLRMCIKYKLNATAFSMSPNYKGSRINSLGAKIDSSDVAWAGPRLGRARDCR